LIPRIHFNRIPLDSGDDINIKCIMCGEKASLPITSFTIGEEANEINWESRSSIGDSRRDFKVVFYCPLCKVLN